MDPTQAEAIIRKSVSVTHQKVLIAKAIVFSSAMADSSFDNILSAVFKANEITVPRPVVIHESVDTKSNLTAVADSISWRLATSEAVWSLIYAGLLFPLDEPRVIVPTFDWTTVVPGSGGMSSGWRFEEYAMPVPQRIRRAPSATTAENQFFAEPDLYLHSLGVPSMHPDVAAAFRESVKCFRNEFFTASFAMLGKASEGAWLELGASLLRLIPKTDETKYSKQQLVLEDPMMGTYKKIEAVLQIFDHQELYGSVSKTAGVRLQELRAVAVWSDAVRDSRNTIHFGVTSAIPNTYEKLAALLIGAVTYVRVLYRVKDTADAMPVP